MGAQLIRNSLDLPDGFDRVCLESFNAECSEAVASDSNPFPENGLHLLGDKADLLIAARMDRPDS
jgi:hypothetical protein